MSLPTSGRLLMLAAEQYWQKRMANSSPLPADISL
ncbi:hypothetical protein EHW99_0969 [Erwinia amylovora]|uniref:Uncharacterized protein n=2 Tax=Erwinia amylovora TaxID=552 RepID=A0A831A188_ERWAM|nr:hypothetical protein EaACW_2649 [Erwinia amylovora ACW56400]QJQ53676.1 hypothetical protein EHX00_0969 [Erwinia amylovora]CBA22100.1 hypothetical protein predicted by Glimmer/Critica [Erwinia amylovora CFBP1430]CCO79493.1 hypothetical protein BN432_2714 [Erwinia amylovora Ea356]CCO83295.1 hypothetical protein BN433_2736 [Erwinia amylovora Ea266]CCO87058.1 hypothetical protein BN434_2688 [Erwinia amylovora CFBP 2585]CCO90853.1 hypothetical protein BN435_2701 [Erwinia amylovora 01SFR-BO]CCO